MICVAREFLSEFFPGRRRRIRLDRNVPMLLVTGHRREKIDAIIGADDRVKRLIVFTRTSRVNL